MEGCSIQETPGALSRRIGRRLRSLRTAADLTLEQMAARSGVSKGMLSQIERGDANPSISTLWKIASALHAPFSRLLSEEGSAVELVPAADRTRVRDEDGYAVEAVFSATVDRPRELYEILMAPGVVHRATAHPAGTEELLLQVEGTLTLQLDGHALCLAPNDALRFAADVAHAYENRSETESRTTCVITYASGWPR